MTAVMVLPVGMVSVSLTDTVIASTLVSTAHVPIAVIAVHIYAALDVALQIGVQGLVGAQLLHNHNLWLLNNHAISWLSLHGHHTWLHLHWSSHHTRLTLHLHGNHTWLTLHQLWLRRGHVGSWVAVRANHLTICVKYGL